MDYSEIKITDEFIGTVMTDDTKRKMTAEEFQKAIDEVAKMVLEGKTTLISTPRSAGKSFFDKTMTGYSYTGAWGKPPGHTNTEEVVVVDEHEDNLDLTKIITKAEQLDFSRTHLDTRMRFQGGTVTFKLGSGKYRKGALSAQTLELVNAYDGKRNGVICVFSGVAALTSPKINEPIDYVEIPLTELRHHFALSDIDETLHALWYRAKPEAPAQSIYDDSEVDNLIDFGAY